MREKIKNANKIMLSLYAIVGTGGIISYGFFVKSVLSLEGIETILRYLILSLLAIWLILYMIFGLRTSIKRKKISFTVLTIITILLIPIFSFSSYYIDKIYDKLEKFTLKETSTYSSVLLTMKETEINENSKLGMINNENDREGYILAKELIYQHKITN